MGICIEFFKKLAFLDLISAISRLFYSGLGILILLLIFFVRAFELFFLGYFCWNWFFTTWTRISSLIYDFTEGLRISGILKHKLCLIQGFFFDRFYVNIATKLKRLIIEVISYIRDFFFRAYYRWNIWFLWYFPT